MPSSGLLPNDDLLTLPKDAGRAIVEAAEVIACPLLGTHKFIQFCRERAIDIDDKRLLRLERLGLFAPVFRVRHPIVDSGPFNIPISDDNNWFESKDAWDTTAIPRNYDVPSIGDHSQEGYYSVFQIDPLKVVLSHMTLHIQMDAFLETSDQDVFDWPSIAGRWVNFARKGLDILRPFEYRRSVALLCQYISNRYYPITQGDNRQFQTPRGYYFDRWINVNYDDWEWKQFARHWNPHEAERLFNLTPQKLRHAYSGMASSRLFCDPLEHWSELTQFIPMQKRSKLKGKALRALVLQSGALMLRLLYEDLYGDKLPDFTESFHSSRRNKSVLNAAEDIRRSLEFTVNEFGINPQPKLTLFVEGKSEDIAIRRIFEELYGVHPGLMAIEIIVLGGVDTATGSKKEDRCRAILRLVDYLHFHQTITFMILDNENQAKRLKQESRKMQSYLSAARYATRSDYIHIWKQSFEFDNFSCSQIARALNIVSGTSRLFNAKMVHACKQDPKAGAKLQELYFNKAGHELSKIKLSGALVDKLIQDSARKSVDSSPIIKIMNRIFKLSRINALPITQEIWQLNQSSKYLGKKRKYQRKK